MIETTASVFLLLAALGLVLQLLSWYAADRKGAEHRLLATQEAANVMERLTAGTVTPERFESIHLSDEAQRRLPEGTLTIKTTTDHPMLTHLTVEIRWLDRSGEPARPVRLSTWVRRTNQNEEGGER